jgi:Putative auto-transporter adhesin, head GIN domain
MFGRNKETNEIQALANERGEMLLKYSNLMRSIADSFGTNELPKTGVVDPSIAEVVLRRFLPNINSPKSEKSSGSEIRALQSNVSKIVLSGPLAITVKKGNSPEISISCSDKEYLSKVTTDIDGKTIRIGLESMSFVSEDGLNITNTGPLFFGMGSNKGGRSVSIRGSTNQVNTVRGAIQSSGVNNVIIGRNRHIASETIPKLDFKIEIVLPIVTGLAIEGSGDIIYLEADESVLNADIAGSGDIHIEGKVVAFNATIAGSGDVKATKLKVKNAKLQVAGSGDIKVYVEDSVDASVAGSGDIKIHGNPAKRSTMVVGSGDIDFV